MLLHATLLFLMGSLLGLRLRALVLLPASVAALALACLTGDLISDSPAGVAMAIVATLVVLQIGYLAGAAAASSRSRQGQRALRSRTTHIWY